MKELLRTPASVVWLVLVAATLISWTLGVEQGGSANAERITGIVIFAITFIKVRFIGLYFMELRDAPLALRALLELYCVVVGVLVMTLFAVAR